MRKIFKDELDEEFLKQLFEDDEKCLKFLSEIKWGEDFVCRKCGNTNYCHGKTPYSRRCTRCKHDESPLVNTIFHNCKFPLSKAFYIAYYVCNQKKSISSYEFARRLSLRQMTCWKFKDKLKKALSKIEDMNPSERLEIEKILILSEEK
ncbi:MAG: transposase [Bacteroidota bacterium]|nr:transposase [Bacteroidota bacterium]